MIVVALIAILAAIALPAYSDYVKKAKVSEVILAASSARTAVAEYAASNNALPTTTHFTPEDQASDYVSGIAWDGTTIPVTAPGIGSGVDTATITLADTLVEATIQITEFCAGSSESKNRPGSGKE